MTSTSPAAYLQTMFVDAQERGTGIGAALVRNLHARLDGTGVAVTLLHHSQVNPLSAPFWYRMGYRPLWTSWEAAPGQRRCVSYACSGRTGRADSSHEC